MKRTLINSLGNTYTSKIISSTSTSEQIFLWNQNFKKLETLKLKQELKVFQQNALKSTAAKITLKNWKSFSFSFIKKMTDSKHKLEKNAIKKGFIVITSTKNGPLKKFVTKESEQIFLSFKNKINNNSNKISDLTNEIINLKIENTGLSKQSNTLKSNLSKISNLKNKYRKIYLNLTNEFKKSYIQLNSIDSKNIEKQDIDKSKIEEALKEIKKFKNNKNNQISIKKEIKKTLEHINNFQSLNFFEKKLFINKSLIKKVVTSKNRLNIYNKYKDTTFDIQLDFLNAETFCKQGVDVLNETTVKIKYINNFKSSFSFNKASHKKEVQLFKKIWKKEKQKFKNKWIETKTILRSSNASSSAKKTKRKEFNNALKVRKHTLKLKHISYNKYKNKLSILKTELKNNLKLKTKILDSELKDNTLKTPIEITPLKYWASIFLGSIFPGLNSIINKQYIKGLIQTAFTILVIIILAWTFGAFPSSSGNGLIGLKSLGHDPATQTGIAIGKTAGVDNDGRFYLVMGVVGIIFLVVGISYWIISVLNNINQNNLARIGVRFSNWKQQKKLLSTAGLPYLLSIPAIIFIIFIVVLPLVSTLFISFTNINQKTWDPHLKQHIFADGITTPISWVGLEQYKRIFNVMGPEFKDVFLWTIWWTIGSTMTLLVVGTLMALIVNQPRIKCKTLFRIIYLLPWAVPAFITIMFFSIFFQRSGIFNKTIGNKIFTPDIDWLKAGNKTKVLMIMLQGWLGHSYIFLLITGMLQSIPSSLYEAARIDGASNTRQFRTITFPIVMSQIAPLIIGQFIFNFNNFGLIYLFNKGGNADTGKTAGPQDIFISWIYKLINGSTNPKPGAAAAMSLIIAAFTVTPATIMFIKSKSFRKADF